MWLLCNTEGFAMPVCNQTSSSVSTLWPCWKLRVMRFFREDAANTQVEYLFMLMLVIFVAMGGITLIGGTAKSLFEQTKNAMP